MPSGNILESPVKEIEIPDLPIQDLIWKDYKAWEDLPAVCCGLTGRTYKYKELYEKSRRFAAALLKNGFEPGEVVSTLLPNTAEGPIIFLGILQAGLVFSPIHVVCTPDEIARRLQESCSEGLIILPESVAVVEEVMPKLSYKIKVIMTPSVDGKEGRLPQGFLSLSEMLVQVSDDIVFPHVKADDLAVIPFSSGNTGLQKGVCLTHRNIVSNLLQHTHSDIAYLRRAQGTEQDVLPFLLSMFHIFGFVCVGLSGLYHGAKLVTLPEFDEQLFQNCMKKHKGTVLHASPSLVKAILTSPNIKKELLETIRIVSVRGSTFGESDVASFKNKLSPKCRFLPLYGLSEAGTVTLPLAKKQNLNSIGVPIPNTKIKILDPTRGEVLPAGMSGEICVKGPQVMGRYLHHPAATREVMDLDGWLHTGDVGYYDKEGYLYLTGRIKELIKVQSYQVAPAELEEVLRSDPAVEDVCVIGVPDGQRGETPVAFIKVKEGQTPPTVDQLKDLLKRKLAPYKQVQTFKFIDKIPRMENGRIIRQQLRDLVKK